MSLMEVILTSPKETRRFPEQFSVREMLLKGTALCAREWRTLLAIQLVVFIVLSISGMLVSGTFPGSFARFVAFALNASLQMIIGLGLLSIYVKYVDGDTVEVLDVFEPIELFWNYAGVIILYCILVGVGVLALVVPGIVVACGLSLAQYLAIDKNMTPVTALKASWKITEGHKGTIALFLASLVVINGIGLMSIVGIIVTAPISGLAYASVYRYFFPKVQVSE